MTTVYIALIYPWHKEEERVADAFDEVGVIEAEDNLSYEGDPPDVNDLIEHCWPGKYHGGPNGEIIDPPKPDAPAGIYYVRKRTFRIDNCMKVHTQWEVEARWGGKSR